jgi:D-arabinose 1-dehydrogenase-like Zn-dependent alcohol dehydrogenase
VVAPTATPCRPSHRSPELLAQNKLVLKAQTFPFDRAAEAYRTSQSGHVRGKLVLVP